MASTIHQSLVPGFDPKQGNGRIAPALATLLKESGGEVPEYVANAANGGGGGGGVGGGGQKPPTDTR